MWSTTVCPLSGTPKRRQRRGDAPRLSRYALLVAGLALAAALGSFVGSLSISEFPRLRPQPPAKFTISDSGAPQASLHAAATSINTRVAKIADRIERVEGAVNEQATKLIRVADAIDRLEKRSATAELEGTGAITTNPVNQTPSESNINKQVLDDCIVQGVRHGRALVESRHGGVFVVRAGASLPDLGRVEAIKRRDGQWLVVTARGLITSGP